jgi:hypothetical protein
MDLPSLSTEDKNIINAIMQSQNTIDEDEDVGSKRLTILASFFHLQKSLDVQKAEVRRVFVPKDSDLVWGLEEGVVNKLYSIFQQARDKSNLEVDWASFFCRREHLDSKPTFIYRYFSRIHGPETAKTPTRVQSYALHWGRSQNVLLPSHRNGFRVPGKWELLRSAPSLKVREREKLVYWSSSRTLVCST